MESYFSILLLDTCYIFKYIILFFQIYIDTINKERQLSRDAQNPEETKQILAF